ncbi:hypothetical protein GCM10010988_40950 [Cnuibacter physcomitrellae]|nr:hypothetical protein GCM10010988_40950 [Cnuibacter physcomitrellae]
MVAEFEADLIRARTREGMKVAKAKGRLRGKKPKLSPAAKGHLVAEFHSGDFTVSELASRYGVGPATVYRAVERAKVRAGVAQPPPPPRLTPSPVVHPSERRGSARCRRTAGELERLAKAG